MKQRLLLTAVLAVLFIPNGVAQVPDGKDIATAIPYSIGQVATGIGAASSTPLVVYAVKLAQGQSITVAAVRTSQAGNNGFGLRLMSPKAVTFATGRFPETIAEDKGCCNGDAEIIYLVPVTGTYYIAVYFSAGTTGYQMTVKSTGTPINIPNPTTSGCLSGRVDYITYSLQQIAAGLPDELSIGGAKACSTCTAKPPLYPEISSRLESALKLNVNVEACYDSAGNIFQIKLVRP